MMVDRPTETPTPLTPRRKSSSASCSTEISLISPQSVRMLSPRRSTLEEMHQSLCMLDQSASSLDLPPLLPARHDSMHRRCHDEDDSSATPFNRYNDENDGRDLPPSPPRSRSNSKDNNNHNNNNIVHVLLPNSPNHARASFTFSRSVSDLPRAGASRIRARSSLPSSSTNAPTPKDLKFLRIFSSKSG